MTFTYQGRDYELLDHKYNATITNERAVEIPIARHFIAACEGDGLEVGNVLGHYGCQAPRRIVDRYEPGIYVENLDVFEIAGSFDWIVSVSTLEHVRWHPGTNQHNPWGAIAALAYMRGLLRDGGRMLVTVGLGQNELLDWSLRNLQVRERMFDDIVNPLGEDMWASVIQRERGATPHENAWTEMVSWPSREDREYGPTHGANAVWIGEWGPA